MLVQPNWVVSEHTPAEQQAPVDGGGGGAQLPQFPASVHVTFTWPDKAQAAAVVVVHCHTTVPPLMQHDPVAAAHAPSKQPVKSPKYVPPSVAHSPAERKLQIRPTQHPPRGGGGGGGGTLHGFGVQVVASP